MAEPGWRSYADPDLGYSLLYPTALFDGAPVPDGGFVRPDLSRPGLGLELKASS